MSRGSWERRREAGVGCRGSMGRCDGWDVLRFWLGIEVMASTWVKKWVVRCGLGVG